MYEFRVKGRKKPRFVCILYNFGVIIKINVKVKIVELFHKASIFIYYC